MQSQVKKPNIVETAANGASDDWINKDYVKFTDDQYASVTGAGYSHKIIASDFDFNIPENKIIREIKVRVKGYASAAATVYLFDTTIYKSGRKKQVNNSVIEVADTDFETIVHFQGMEENPKSMMSVDYVNSSDFKIGIGAILGGGTFYVDVIEVEVLYSDYYQKNKRPQSTDNVGLDGYVANNWNYMEYIRDSDIGTYMRCEQNIFVTSSASNYAKMTNFGFNIPANAQIRGIELVMVKQAWFVGGSSNYVNIRDLSLKPIKNNVLLEVERGKIGQPWRMGASFNNYTGTYVHGGDTDLWDTTWTPAEINSANFGFAFACQFLNNPLDAGTFNTISEARVYDVICNVYYTYSGRLYKASKNANNVAQATSDLGSSIAITNPSNARLDDGNYATASYNGSTQLNMLTFSDFEFDLPSTASVMGLTIRVKGKADTNPTSTKFFGVSGFAIKKGATVLRAGANSLGSHNDDEYSFFVSAEELREYGGSTLLWGTNIGPTDVNDETFSIVLYTKISSSSGNVDAFIESLEVEVAYNIGTKKNIFKKNRKGYIKLGFSGENIPIFLGKSEYPNIERKGNRLKLHFFDELSRLSDQRLSEGELKLNIRTDRYIWGILDEVYYSYFDVIAHCDTNEDWVFNSGTNYASTQEIVSHRFGDGAIKLNSRTSSFTNALATFAFPSPLNLSGYDNEDYFYASIYAEDHTKIHEILITIKCTGGDYTIYLNSSSVKSGWNDFYLQLKDIPVSLVPDLRQVNSIEMRYRTNSASFNYVLIDEIRFCKKTDYPLRYFDIGLQEIPVAWWSSNTVLYEIKTACEAEGARFYTDEEGNFHFENRQFYNTKPEYKRSRHGFNFNNILDLEYRGKDTDIINTVVVKIKPRKVVDTPKVMWTYPEVIEIDTGESVDVWASFTDPCPTTTTGIILPVSTTDYLANAQEDGLGTNKTSALNISIVRFAQAAKLTLTNTDASTIYVTFLQVRGTPAEYNEEISLVIEDEESIAKYGTSPSGGYVVENKYLADENYAEIIGTQLIDWYKDPVKKILLKSRCVPWLQIGDLISIKNDDIGAYYIMRIIKLKYFYDKDSGLNMDIESREVGRFETLSFFTIGVSAIEGNDVIST